VAELAYNAVANADRTHTVTRATGTSVLGSNEMALVTALGSRGQPELRAAVRAAIQMVRLDIMDASEPADFPSSGSRTI
jgi:hypothetical protein